MALNFSRNPFVNGYFLEGGKVEGYGVQSSFHRDVDIVDLLPYDPFGMHMNSTVSAIAEWLEDFKVDYGEYDSSASYKDDIADFNFILNNVRVFDERELVLGSVYGDGMGIVRSLFPRIGESRDIVECLRKETSGVLHEGFVYVLGYLGARDILAFERVCRYSRYMVRSDPFLWSNIHIDHPLNRKIHDHDLVNLTNRAKGSLQSLTLVECQRINDASLKHVIDNNPRLTKLALPGCHNLGIANIVDSLKGIKSKPGASRLKHLRVGGICVNNEHFEELKALLGADRFSHQNSRKPHFYNRKIYLLCDDENAIDIDICPKCQVAKLVYDCPAPGCQTKNDAPQLCRACKICTPRCIQCGHCFVGGDFEENFCLEFTCLKCCKNLGQELGLSG